MRYLSYRFLNSVDLTNEQKQLVMATVNNTYYQVMKHHLKKVFTTLH